MRMEKPASAGILARAQTIVTIQVIDRRALMGELNTASVEEPPESVAFRRSLLKA